MIPEKTKVLFVCVHNSARSQMAEAFLNHWAGNRFMAESAGMDPGELNPLAVEVMQEIGIDISRNQTKSVYDLLKVNKKFDYVVTVCDETSAEKCPALPGKGKRLHWSFQDPSSFKGGKDKKLKMTREVRNEIEKKIRQWLLSLPEKK